MTVPEGKATGDPLVSIVIPTYNQADYLAIAIDSVLAQDYKNIECIVIDDGSTDGTPAVLERYQGRVACVRQANSGQSRALNHGWSMCHGEILGYLSSDDRLLPQAVSTLVTALSEDSTAVMAYCDFELIDDTGRVIRIKKTEEFCKKRITEELDCLAGPGALFRKEILIRTGGWREHLRQCPDFDFFLRALEFGVFVRVGTCLAQFRIHDQSTSFRPVSYTRCDEVLEVVKEFWEDKSGREKKSALATSYLKSARAHAQSGRFFSALARMGSACRYDPRKMCAIRPWRLFISGFLRSSYYKYLRKKK